MRIVTPDIIDPSGTVTRFAIPSYTTALLLTVSNEGGPGLVFLLTPVIISAGAARADWMPARQQRVSAKRDLENCMLTTSVR